MSSSSILPSSGAAVLSRVSSYHKRLIDLMANVGSELTSAVNTDQQRQTPLSFGLLSMFEEAYSWEACGLISWEEPDECQVVQARLFKFVYMDAHNIAKDAGWVAPYMPFVKALLNSVTAAVPLCRNSEACLRSELTSALWSFANSGVTGQFDPDSVGFIVFSALRNFLPQEANWNTPWQCPVFFDGRLPSRPVWRISDLPSGSTIHKLFFALKDAAADVAEDLHSGILSDNGRAFIRRPAFGGLRYNNETTGWEVFTLYRNSDIGENDKNLPGLDPIHCRITPRTCKLLKELSIPIALSNNLPCPEVVDFLRADPGTQVIFHTARANSRLTVQLCLAGCDDGKSFIQVGPERLSWSFGEPIVFDDSYLHSIRIDPDLKEPRWVLSIQLIYPALETQELFAAHYASHEAFAWDVRQNNSGVGGIPPPPMEEGSSGFPAEELYFVNRILEDVHLYAAVWGPHEDGPRFWLGKASANTKRPYDQGDGLLLPSLAHRTLLSAVSAENGIGLGAWRVDARDGGRRVFVLPIEPQSI